MKLHSKDRRQPGIRTITSECTNLVDTVLTTNENCGKLDNAAERRRIQNRLNQRAFRQRLRAGESSKQYKPRSTSGLTAQQNKPSLEHELESLQATMTLSYSRHWKCRAASVPSCDRLLLGARSNCVWDELAELINRNFMFAVFTNALHLSLDFNALCSGAATTTPRIARSRCPATLKPVGLQYEVAHDPLIDTIPHPRLRFNILCAIAEGQIDSTAFSSYMRASGVLKELTGGWQRSGMVVWSCPERITSWELSESFVRWTFLLRGCEDLITATNEWRSRRGEGPLPIGCNPD